MKIRLKHFSAGSIRWLDVIICTVIILAPVLQQHKGFFVNAAWSALILGFPFCALRVMLSGWKIGRNVFFGLVLILAYILWTVIDHGFSAGDLMKFGILMFYYLAVVKEDFNFRYLVNISAAIILAACAAIVMQYFCYYVLHFRLQFLSPDTLLDSSSRWIKRLSVTTATATFYRPSAFFLEPSHVFLFSFPTTLYMLFSPRSTRTMHRLGFVMIGGILASTSGMGIAFSLACILAYFVMYKNPVYGEGSLKNFLSLRKILIPLMLLVLLVILYEYSDIVHKSLVRVISESETGYNAVAGRTSAGTELIQGLDWQQFLLGVTDAMGELGAALSAFQATLYKYGIVGIAISYLYYLYCFACTRRDSRYLCLILLVISFVCAHTHNLFFMLSFSAFIFEGIKENACAAAPVRDLLPAVRPGRTAAAVEN
nr:hypothetical protein [Lachnospiraceae bacterium]